MWQGIPLGQSPSGSIRIQHLSWHLSFQSVASLFGLCCGAFVPNDCHCSRGSSRLVNKTRTAPIGHFRLKALLKTCCCMCSHSSSLEVKLPLIIRYRTGSLWRMMLSGNFSKEEQALRLLYCPFPNFYCKRKPRTDPGITIAGLKIPTAAAKQQEEISQWLKKMSPL